MAQFGWGALVKTALLSAVATSGVWLVSGLAYYDREWGRPATAVAANGDLVQTADYLPQPIGNAATATPAFGPAVGARSDPGQAAAIRLPAPGSLAMPVSGIQPEALVDTFAESRSDGRVHDAIDIAAPRGTAVVAAAAGTVEKLFISKQGGLTVYVRSPDRRMIYYYAHLNGYAPSLIEGQTLAAGDPIGFVGSTGNANAEVPHLHLAILATSPQANWSEPATAINPYPLLGGTH